MTKFEVSNPTKFEGQAAIYYNLKGVLCWIDCRETNMSPEVVHAFKAAVPATLKILMEGKSFGPGTTIVQVGYRIAFLEWWKLYNKKINKARCIPVYEALSDSDTVQCLNGTTVYNAFLAKVKVRQKLDPENFLKNRSWENEWQ